MSHVLYIPRNLKNNSYKLLYSNWAAATKFYDGVNWNTITIGSAPICSSGMSQTGKYMLFNTYTTPNNGLYVSSDFGATKRLVATGIAQNEACRPFVSRSGQYMIGGFGRRYADKLYYSTNYGESFSELKPAGNTTKHWACAFASEDFKYIVATVTGNATDYIYLSTNYGASFTVITSLGNCYRTSNSISDFANVIVTTNTTNASIEVTYNQGDNWTVHQPAGSGFKWIYEAKCSNTGKYHIVCYGNTTPGLFISSDYGATWVEKRPSGVLNGYEICGISKTGKIMAVIDSDVGKMYISVDYGNTWKTDGSIWANDHYGASNICIEE